MHFNFCRVLCSKPFSSWSSLKIFSVRVFHIFDASGSAQISIQYFADQPEKTFAFVILATRRRSTLARSIPNWAFVAGRLEGIFQITSHFQMKYEMNYILIIKKWQRPQRPFLRLYGLRRLQLEAAFQIEPLWEVGKVFRAGISKFSFFQFFNSFQKIDRFLICIRNFSWNIFSN